MTLRLAVRGLLTRPVRSAVLACGFGFGIAVMAALLGVGEVILEQALSPALSGGGDVVVHGGAGSIGSARFVASRLVSTTGALSNTRSPLAERVRAVSPSLASTLYLVRDGEVVPLRVRGGIPTLEHAVGDPETSGVTTWVDSPSDRRWTSPDPGDVLRSMDRFHPIPHAPAWEHSWAEWLYFNGRSRDGATSFYLTFLTGPRTRPGFRLAGVRLQLERNGVMTSHSRGMEVPEDTILSEAPDLVIGPCRVRLDGMTYRIDLDLEGNDGAPPVRGTVTIEAVEGRSIPPFVIRGARGWISGYTVPVLAGKAGAALQVGNASLTIEEGAGYHDHNWGFWEGVTWQWGQVAHEDLSFVYGRVHPPADAADPDRIPGFLGVLGPDGPLGYSTNVTIQEEEDVAARARPDPRENVVSGGDQPSENEPRGTATGSRQGSAHQESDAPPRTIRVRARGGEIDLTMTAAVESAVRTHMGGAFAPGRRTVAEAPGSGSSPILPGSGASRPEAPRYHPGRHEGRQSPLAHEGEGRSGEEGPTSERTGAAMTFLQLRAHFHVTGQVAGRTIDFTALGSAETFRDH